MRKYIFILCILCMMLCVACGKNENDSELITKETESIRRIDLQPIFEKIEIGDKVVGFPFMLKELPENYTMELPDDEKKSVRTSVLVNGKLQIGKNLGVEFESLDKFYDGKVNCICWVDLEKEGLEEQEAKLSVDGITLGSTMDEVIEKFGVPSTMNGGESGEPDTYTFMYYGEGEEYICFSTDMEKKINYIEISRQ